MKITRALISVADKTGLEPLARALTGLGIELLASGGTAAALHDAGLHLTTVEEVTGCPALLGGRVKTLHPAIHGGILARRDVPDDMRDLAQQQIQPVDLVIVNLYPFERAMRQPGVTREAAIEQMDIGGVALLRAAAKNHQWVGVVCDPSQYTSVIDELTAHDGALTDATRRALATQAFARTAQYDLAIHQYLNGPPAQGALPSQLTVTLQQVQPLRYGENPHQHAGWYAVQGLSPLGLSQLQQLGGKELSYNNLLDAGTALATVWEHAEPAACIIKHLSPCGVATAGQLAEAVTRAHACDPLSAFGGVVGVNRPLDVPTARAIHDVGFLEVVVAPAAAADAAKVLAGKKNLRLLVVPGLPAPGEGLSLLPWDMRTGVGGLLVQTPDAMLLDARQVRVASTRAPSAQERAALEFAWRVVKHVRSNAIVLARNGQTVGIGGGLPSRIDAVLEGIRKAGERARGAVLASDAFFPKTDNITAAAQAGVTAVIQPGGSRLDAEVIAAANQANLAMLLTGLRHFKH